MLAVTSLTMALIPLLGMVARRIAVMLEKRKPLEPELAAAPPADETGHAIVVGHGRVGPDRLRHARAARAGLHCHRQRPGGRSAPTAARPRGLLR
jgi:hypothetical protein